jgi:hypothetical protein
MAGAVAAVVSIAIGFMINLVLGSLLVSLYTSMPPALLSTMSWRASMGILSIPLGILIYGGFGALAGFLSMEMFFKDRSTGR